MLVPPTYCGKMTGSLQSWDDVSSRDVIWDSWSALTCRSQWPDFSLNVLLATQMASACFKQRSVV